MKNSFKALIAGTLCALALVTAISIVPNVRAADFHYGTINVPSAVANVTNNTITSTNGTAWAIPQNVPITFQIDFTPASPGGSNFATGFEFSGDGTNWTTTQPLVLTAACSGATNRVYGTNVAASVFAGWQWLRCGYTSTTQTNGLTLNAIRFSYFY